jgi:hypothetical protein
VFTGVFTFTVEAYPLYAASALSANSFARSSFAAAFPLFGVQMVSSPFQAQEQRIVHLLHPIKIQTDLQQYEKLNYHWATTLLAFLTLVMAPFPYVFFVYGKRLRRKSKYGSV